MKKIISLLAIPLLALTSLGLSGCSDNNKTNSPLIISEVMDGTGNNRALELYNVSDKTIDLSAYSLEMQFTSEKSFIEELDGSLEANKTFVIVSNTADDDLKAKADMLSDFGFDGLLFTGKQPIILRKNNKKVDIVGTENYFSDSFCVDLTLTRKKEFLYGRKTYDEYDWIRYRENEQQYLGTIDVSITDSELLSGPRLESEYLTMPFSVEKSAGQFYGGGGLMIVTVSQYVDGDTTWFNFSDKDEMDRLGLPQISKVRYQNIDTPESYEGNIQEFGLVAKENTNAMLKKAGMIQVQTILDGSIVDTFNRILGWVWIDGELLNFDVVKKGYSEVAFGSVDNMSYKGVTYTSFLYNAMLYAQRNKLGRFGEIDPYWDYKTGHVKDGIHGNEK